MLPFTVGPAPADDVPRHADHEQIADALVEDQFGRNPRVGAPDDYGNWRLPLRKSREVFRSPPWMDKLATHEPLVALEQPGEYGVRITGLCRPAGGQSGRGEGERDRATASPESRMNSRRDE